MTNEQIKQQITLLTEQRKRLESFTLPLATGIIIALVSKEYLGNFLYICLAVGGITVVALFEIEIVNITKKINSLINQLT